MINVHAVTMKLCYFPSSFFLLPSFSKNEYKPLSIIAPPPTYSKAKVGNARLLNFRNWIGWIKFLWVFFFFFFFFRVTEKMISLKLNDIQPFWKIKSIVGFTFRKLMDNVLCAFSCAHRNAADNELNSSHSQNALRNGDQLANIF